MAATSTALSKRYLDQLDVIDYHIHTIASWIRETGIDCIRMDTAKHVERVFWNFFKDQIRGRFPDVSLIGEALVFADGSFKIKMDRKSALVLM